MFALMGATKCSTLLTTNSLQRFLAASLGDFCTGSQPCLKKSETRAVGTAVDYWWDEDLFKDVISRLRLGLRLGLGVAMAYVQTLILPGQYLPRPR